MVRSGGRWVDLDHADLAAAAAALAERAQPDPAHRRRHAAPRPRPRGLAPRRRHLRGGRRLGGRPPRRRRRTLVDRRRRHETPDAFVGDLRTYQAEAYAWLGFLDSAGIGGCLALDMGLGKTPTMLAHLLAPPRGDGPALVIAPPAVVGNWAAEAQRFTPDSARRRAPRRVTRRRGRDRRRSGRRRRRHHHLRHRGARRRRDQQRRVDARGPRRGAGDQEPVERHRAAAAPHPRTHRASRSPARRSRTASATSGRSSTTRTPGSWARGRSSSPRLSDDGESKKSAAEHALRALNGILVFRRTKARADDRRRAARPHRRARPLLDDHRADRPLPSGARRARGRGRPARGRRAAQGPDPRRHHRAQADLQPPVGVPARRPAARRPFRASSPGSRRSSSRCSRPGSACSSSPTSPSGA